MPASAADLPCRRDTGKNCLEPLSIPLHEDVARVLFLIDVLSKHIRSTLVEQIIPFVRPEVLIELIAFFRGELPTFF